MNNEQVIKYVSENSKNPHAAMMVEQLLTGWDVEYLTNNEEWVTATRPNWSPAVKYRLVKPKIKPAYRVYRYIGKQGSITQDRYSDGRLSRIGDETQIEWLSDWTEFDPEPKRWPTPLVERIAAIDIKAAEWIVDHWDELLDDKYVGNSSCRNSNNLINMFVWHGSPQGYGYWLDLHAKLGK